MNLIPMVISEVFSMAYHLLLKMHLLHFLVLAPVYLKQVQHHRLFLLLLKVFSSRQKQDGEISLHLVLLLQH